MNNDRPTPGQFSIKFVLPVIIGFLICFSGQAETLVPTQQKLIERLQAGGYTLYFRHEATDWSQQDHIDKAGDWLSCDSSRVRQLSDAGRRRAAATGQHIRALGIPVERVYASPYCRTVDTAKLLDLGQVTATTDVMNLRVARFFGGRDAIVKTAQNLLSTRPPKGKNTVIVAHGNVAQAATPAYPDEGESIIFQADGNGNFHLIGRLTPADWKQLANSLSQ